MLIVAMTTTLTRPFGRSKLDDMKTQEERFWSYVNKDGPILNPELGACWEWTAYTSDGYGRFDGPSRAHRFGWALVARVDPGPRLVLHRCDNRKCVRYEHLYLGDNFDNMRDKLLRGRHPSVKLTESEVTDIRTLYAFGALQSVLAEQFGVCHQHISKLVNHQKRRIPVPARVYLGSK